MHPTQCAWGEDESGGEFIRRFLLHVLPEGFMRIRHFGFLANRCRRAKLAAITAWLQAAREATATALAAPFQTREPPPSFDGYPCPQCREGRLEVRGWIAPKRPTGG